MKSALVGYTGFVGSNLVSSYQFDYKFNSKNIEEAYGLEPDLLVYAGVPAEMFKANSFPETDFEIIKQAIDNIRLINAKRVVLISTVAVYDSTYDVDETHSIDENRILPYGKNRLFLEKWVMSNCESSLVVRLPAIYGKNLKKNFIYDYVNYIPGMLNEAKFQELSSKEALIKDAYILEKDGFYHCSDCFKNKRELYDCFARVGFCAHNFTDSRSIYQFYNLERLWHDIEIALDNGMQLLNLVTEPVNVGELYYFLEKKEFVNELKKEPFNYNVKSQYASIFGGDSGYMLSKKQVMEDLREFVRVEMENKWH